MRRVFLPLAGLLIAWGLLLGAPACPPPAPQPTPTPCVTCPAGQHCEGGVCVADPPPPDPSPVCQEGETCGCWVKPPGEEWQQLPPCPPTPTCPATCPAGQSCTDPLAGCVPTPPEPPAGCSIDGEPGPEIPGYRPALGGQVNDAMTSLRPECAAGSRCVVPASRQAWQARVVLELRRRGLCAGQHTPETDEIAVSTGIAAPREGWHVYAGPGAGPGTVVWSPGAARPAYEAPGGTPPPIEPPPVAGCPAPVTPKVAMWGLTFRNRWWDCTPKFSNGDAVTWTGVPVTRYCTAIGMSDRIYCPARPEGDPNRRACEGVGIGGYASATPLWRCEAGAAEVNEANPFQARCAPGWIEACATDGTNCTRAKP